MWRDTVVKTAATFEPLTVSAAKRHLRVTEQDDDGLIGGYISAARALVEASTGTKLATQTLTMRAYDWADLAKLPSAPIASVSSVKYTDTAGDIQTLDSSVYEARLWGMSPGIDLAFGESWPTVEPGSLIEVEAVAGYALGSCPPEVLAALKLVVGDLYAFRETVEPGASAGKIPMSTTVDALLANHRIHLV